MKIIMLQDDLYEYLNRVVHVHAGAGINPEEGLAIYHLYQALKLARTVDDTQVAKVATGDIAGVPVATVAIERADKDSSPIPERRDYGTVITRDEDRGPGNGLYDRPA
jgi:hypothetical protein